MVITNLPYPEGPGHLPDLSMVSVIFDASEQPIAIAATTAHHVDMGGYAPGSMPLGVTEIYQEGLQIPPIRVMQRGQMNEPLLKLINQNVRTKLEVRGDLMAQFAAAKIGEAGSRFVNAHRSRRASPLYARRARLCGRRMRAGIRALPDGDFFFEDFLDDDGISDQPIRIAVTLRVRDDQLIADFTGTAPQVLGPLNARLSAARACMYYVAKAVIDPDLPTCVVHIDPLKCMLPKARSSMPVIRLRSAMPIS